MTYFFDHQVLSVNGRIVNKNSLDIVRVKSFANLTFNPPPQIADSFLSAGDLVFVRPISTAATIGAFGIFAVVAPFTTMAGCTEETYEGLVESVGKFSFDRDLGDFKK